MEQELEILQGSIESVVYQNYDNGYSVLRLNIGQKQAVTVVGTIPLPVVGERLMVTGKWSTHSNYGRQFEAEFLERLMPETASQIQAYLAGRVIKGIGPVSAARIVAKFGDKTLQIMEREPMRLAEVSGISEARAKAIGEEFRVRVGMRQLMEFFAQHQLPAELALRAYKLFGESTVDLLYDDPYLLMDEGLEAPFAAVDRFAIELGIAGDDPRRVEAGILFQLEYNLTVGHSFLPERKLLESSAQLLSLDPETIGAGHCPADRGRAAGAVLLEGHYGGLPAGALRGGGLQHPASAGIRQKGLPGARTTWKTRSPPFPGKAALPIPRSRPRPSGRRQPPGCF